MSTEQKRAILRDDTMMKNLLSEAYRTAAGDALADAADDILKWANLMPRSSTLEHFRAALAAYRSASAVPDFAPATEEDVERAYLAWRSCTDDARASMKLALSNFARARSLPARSAAVPASPVADPWKREQVVALVRSARRISAYPFTGKWAPTVESLDRCLAPFAAIAEKAGKAPSGSAPQPGEAPAAGAPAHPLDGLLEPAAAPYDVEVSIAISLKRLADHLVPIDGNFNNLGAAFAAREHTK